MNFKQEKNLLLKNPPKEVVGWVERVSDYGKTVTKGKKYKVINYFRYLNHYGDKGQRYVMWDEFITIKNDGGWTVKMNLRGFEPCEAPLTKLQILEKRILELENKIK